MKKGYILSVAILLVAVAGCGKKKTKVDTRGRTSEVRANIDIPMAEDGIKSFFDEDINEFALADDVNAKELGGSAIESMPAQVTTMAKNDEFAWEDTAVDGNAFKVVHFEFDQYSIGQNQIDAVSTNVALIKKSIDECRSFGNPEPTVVIDGHACHSAGSRVYNLALSEKRAKALADELVNAGISRECIKIVGRGSEMPAMINGQPCEGDRVAQAPNRRDEIRILYS